MILLGLIVPAAGATISLTGSADWLVADGADSKELTVQVLDENKTPLSGCTVALSVDPTLGRISPAVVTAGASGTATATFTTSTTSGAATITARAGEAQATFEQQIDHDHPYRIRHLHYDSEVTAGDTTTITLGLADRHGNAVDNRNDAETVHFIVGSVNDDAAFIDEGVPVHELERTVDAMGNISVSLRTGHIAGENIVRITARPGSIERYISIRGLPTGHPAAITASVRPHDDPIPYQPADRRSTFTVSFTLSDPWGNPAAGRDLRVSTSLGEGEILTTNGRGEVAFTYGPKDTTGRVTITATAIDNQSVTASKTVEFVHTDPVDMLLSANPQSMPSRDVDPTSHSEVRAKVVDIKGNPVAGETVKFEITSSTSAPSGQAGEPRLETSSAITDEEGYATTPFHPGTFMTDRKAPGWSAAAKGTATVRATWGDVTRDISLTWMNYPYLSVETSVSSPRINVTDTVDVTVRLKGDGWALRPDPIDVVLVMDRSGSMSLDNPSRISSAKGAAKVFVAEMDPSRDRIGVVSYNSSASCDLRLTSDYSSVNKTIDDLRPSGFTATRKALYTAIQEMIARRSQGAVHAVILMSDGEYNHYGDPLARGNGNPNKHDWWTTREDYTILSGLEPDQQNMAVYAAEKNIRLYMISFSDDIGEGKATWETMDILAGATGGRHYHAATGDDLARIYTEIAGELKTEAGVNTVMNLDFSAIQVNGEDRVGSDVFSYVPRTAIKSWIGNEIILHCTRDDTPSWTASPPNLSFDIGTVRLGQTWEATFRLRALAGGNANIFGPRSTITFNDGAGELGLPTTLITAVPDLTDTGLRYGTLHLTDPRYTCPEPVRDILTAAWDVAYTGFLTVTEVPEYSGDDGLSWVRFDTLTADNTTTGGTTALYVGNLPPGKYRIRVRASADDAPYIRPLEFPPIQVGEREKAYIRIT
ncbi:MAG: VWA domain-containing protein [Methanomicrobiales archaeon]|nr:VWA domain-containing protein [Methanomicrobiales archaeon]